MTRDERKKMNGTKRADIKIGRRVAIVLKQDQRSGKRTEGVVQAILTKSATHPHGIKFSAYLESNQFVVQVQDDGEPIPAEIADAVFEPQGQWSSAPAQNPAQAGSGLGLPMVKMVIEQMDGNIWYESGEGPGNTFFISLPVVG